MILIGRDDRIQAEGGGDICSLFSVNTTKRTEAGTEFDPRRGPHAPLCHMAHGPMVTGFTSRLWRSVTQYSVNSLLYSEICGEGGGDMNQILYAHSGPSALPLICPHHFDTALWELLGGAWVHSHVVRGWDGSCAVEMRTLSARITKPDWRAAWRSFHESSHDLYCFH